MFTGLIEEKGKVQAIRKGIASATLTISSSVVTGDLKVGDSVSVNGVCLTATLVDKHTFSVDAVPETMLRSNLGSLHAGSVVNLERALKVGDRLGGHFVQGHVDAVGEIISLEENGQDHVVEVSLPAEIHELCVAKGSISIDGISLTIADLKESSAVFWITPHTFEHTNLKSAELGSPVNLEGDMLAKHVAKLMNARS